ncbi:type II toxin-antitoxin system mRNA interferase toxin, RelE/StbE family [Synechococcales cyanobacterium C]|uniref:Type II toxin-antitoxin system mRNA interferase toxin, RelE/StbE family n=1 Tax=Petrachloros mirabilis ULC683 TaxID=2781853 RepID=A0A8K2A6S2_9CYAN|nr:type II toxin-antitoxin system RelE/ParE family toxin [Petrachloros mirabilis]NCJ05375.1 type II toxin-antitoxin system mRNA interferase toxin, RelE/StbE family [Petrachloros mirabilis ULC683]
MQARWLRKALRNLEQAHDYIAKDDPEAAIRTALKIQVAVEQLVQFPLMGRVGRVKGTRELVIANTPYFVVYRLKDNTVEILRVLHTSRRYPD